MLTDGIKASRNWDRFRPEMQHSLWEILTMVDFLLNQEFESPHELFMPNTLLLQRAKGEENGATEASTAGPVETDAASV